jgi:CheY-like chemotaxis protein
LACEDRSLSVAVYSEARFHGKSDESSRKLRWNRFSMPNYTILLIDYNPRSVTTTKGPLEQAGYTVAVAADGIAGIQAFDDLKPDLTMIEAMLPKKHGFDVCVELKATEHGKKTPVLILTGLYKGQRYRSQARHQLGCDRYLEKPISDEDLLSAVQAFLPPLPKADPQIDRKPAPVPPVVAAEPVPETKPLRQPTLVESHPVNSVESEIAAQLDTLFPEPATAAAFVEPDGKPDLI